MHVLVGILVASSSSISLMPGLVIFFGNITTFIFNLCPAVDDRGVNCHIYLGRNAASVHLYEHSLLLDYKSGSKSVSLFSFFLKSLSNTSELALAEYWFSNNSLFIVAERAQPIVFFTRESECVDLLLVGHVSLDICFETISPCRFLKFSLCSGRFIGISCVMKLSFKWFTLGNKVIVSYSIFFL